MIQDSTGALPDFNPYLAANKASNERADGPAALGTVRGSIDAPGRAVGNTEQNLIWQTRDHAATPYENRLGDALEAAFESGADSPEQIAEHLNAAGVHAPDGAPWTAASFEAVMRELGA